MSDDNFKNKLSSEQFHVMREGGTEKPFSVSIGIRTKKGMYKCAACGTELFSSKAKFDSGTGWPSFTEPVNLKNIELKEDKGQGMLRIEVVCKNCGSHLGHVFDESPSREVSDGRSGPKSTGKRYCINSVCLNLEKNDK